ncbi:hypothetical protein COU74_02750 [Candidatus Peregrinibacteria bacterium CG10_big_fil_rev_8_21_14_0_10_36_19]|nr:MAG: hypothetical protein COU74_02750 [Candidatus Peregrinibacteria bacterium CG10_big_fil_rev_8_21_14_0_10_36_19]
MSVEKIIGELSTDERLVYEFLRINGRKVVDISDRLRKLLLNAGALLEKDGVTTVNNEVCESIRSVLAFRGYTS